jgi:hypothetical protein
MLLFNNYFPLKLVFFKQFGGNKKVLESPYACVVLHGDRTSFEVYLFIYFFYQLINLYINLYINLFINLFIYLFINLYINLFINFFFFFIISMIFYREMIILKSLRRET